MKKFVVLYRYFNEELQDFTFDQFKEFNAYAPALAHAKSQSKKWDRVDLDCHEIKEGESFQILEMNQTILWSESYKDGNQVPRITQDGNDIMRWDIRQNMAPIVLEEEEVTEGEISTQEVVNVEENTPEPEVVEQMQDEVVDVDQTTDLSDVAVGDCFKMDGGTKIIKVVAIHKSFTRHEAIWSTGTEIGFYANKSLLTEKVANLERYDSGMYEYKKSQIMMILSDGVKF